MTPKEKIIKYLKYNNISQDKFSRTCDVSSGFLRQGKSFSIDLLKTIRTNYPDLNMDWLLYNEGDMLLEEESTQLMANEIGAQYENGCINCDHLEELLEAKNETIAILKHQLGINNDGDKSKAS